MCGRYTHQLTWKQIVNLYRLTLPEEPPERLGPSYNVAPTQVGRPLQELVYANA